MTEAESRDLADNIILKLLQHQPDALGTYPLLGETAARKAAQSLAAFRQELIAQLVQQP